MVHLLFSELLVGPLPGLVHELLVNANAPDAVGGTVVIGQLDYLASFGVSATPSTVTVRSELSEVFSPGTGALSAGRLKPPIEEAAEAGERMPVEMAATVAAVIVARAKNFFSDETQPSFVPSCLYL